MQRITSRQNPRYKEVVALAASSRERRKTGLCILEGEHLVAVHLDRCGAPEALAVADDALADPRIAAVVARVPDARVLVLPRALFAAIAVVSPDVGVLATVPAPVHAPRADASFSLLLEDVQDPGNVGTIIRTAAAAGVDQVLLSKHCAFAWAPKALRAGQGGHFLTTVCEDVDLAGWIAAFRAAGGVTLATLPRDGEDVQRADLRFPLAVAIGNEGAGLSPALVAACDRRVTIAMAGPTESLNAAAAAAVVLFECRRRRGAWRGTAEGRTP